ncbi:hypothetical protein RFI_36629, partial [Reticulomyxa filosa]
MANRIIAQKYPETQTEQNQDIITFTPFQSLKELPIPFIQSQCVQHKHELLICGGYDTPDCTRDCYSYNTLKNEYKFICKYPSDVQLWGHCVVKLVDNNNNDGNETTLLSFGGYPYKHTLMMKYVSVWSDDNDNEMKKSNNCNEWIPFTDNHSNPIIIGRDNDDYRGVRAVIGGSSNHLLFITYFQKNISVFDLNTFKFIVHDTLPTDDYIWYHCFVLKPENEQEQETIKSNEEKNKKEISEMLLFCFKTGLSIEYDEDDNTFQVYQLPVCDHIAPLYAYAYVCINNIILFFGGCGCKDDDLVASKSMHKYSIREYKWMTFQNILPSPFHSCVAIFNEDNTYVHIIGGKNDKKISTSTHMKTQVSKWASEKEVKKGIELKVEKEGKENEI